MKKNPMSFVGLIFLLAFVSLSGCSSSTKNPELVDSSDDSAMNQPNEPLMETPETESSSEPTDSMMEDSEPMVINGQPGRAQSRFVGAMLAGVDSPLVDFNKSDYDRELAAGTPILLYFYANWCPLCKAEVGDSLIPAFNQMTQSGVVGFRVNYNDSDTDADEKGLARQYGVAYQHTKILLKNGEVVLKAPDSWDISRYQKELSNLLN